MQYFFSQYNRILAVRPTKQMYTTNLALFLYSILLCVISAMVSPIKVSSRLIAIFQHTETDFHHNMTIFSIFTAFLMRL